MGCWTPVERVGDGGDWSAVMAAPGRRAGSRCAIAAGPSPRWSGSSGGAHNVANALAAIAAARHAGVEPATAARALGDFTGVRRRLEHCATVDGVALYDDFAHHPTAIEAAIGALRVSLGGRGSEGGETCEDGEAGQRGEVGGAGDGRLLAVLELASNTMRRGTHRATLGPALSGADAAWVLAPARASAPCGWDVQVLARGDGAVRVRDDIDTIVRECCEAARPGDAILVMSNAGFGGIQERLAAALRDRARARGDSFAGA